MTVRDYLSIGEVLAVLLDEFSDVTISKIRFLESQGLINPERTPSGYRKFSDDEVEKLRYVLRQQKDTYLPLRVIRDQLQDETGDHANYAELSPESIDQSEAAHPTSRQKPRVIAAVKNSRPEQTEARREQRQQHAQAVAHADKTESLPRDLLMSQCDIPPEVLKSLETAGLVEGHNVGDTTFYDEQSVSVARVAKRFMDLGIDVRHLRAWKMSADREVDLFEQRILPLMRQRNPGAREEATEMLEEFVLLGAKLREALMNREITRLTEGRK